MSLTVILDNEPIKAVREVSGKFVASFCVGQTKNKTTNKYEGGLWVQMWFNDPVQAWDRVTVSSGYIKATTWEGKPQVTLYPSQGVEPFVERQQPQQAQQPATAQQQWVSDIPDGDIPF